MRTKTWKREVATALFVWLGVLAFKGEVQIVEILTWPTFLFGAAAFGLDAFSKQLQQSVTISSVRRSESNSQYTSGEDK